MVLCSIELYYNYMAGKKFSFGKRPRMQEVVPGTDATLTFRGDPSVIEDGDYGEKYSFPITLISHDSHSQLPFDCDWITKSDVGKELWNGLNAEKPNKDFVNGYNNSNWKLTRFDTGTYWIDQL